MNKVFSALAVISILAFACTKSGTDEGGNPNPDPPPGNGNNCDT